MTENERAVFELVRQNPFISQLELAERVQISRSAVANIISSLVKKNTCLAKPIYSMSVIQWFASVQQI